MSKVIKLGNYKGIEFKVEKVPVSNEEVEQQIQMILAQSSQTEEKDGDTVENGDIATIDFVGLKDDVAFEGGTGNDYDLEIGSGSFIPGFEEQMIGMKVNETRDLNLTFPENYQAEDLAGQDVVFKVTVKKLSVKKEAELNDDFVEGLGVPEIKTVEDLKAYINEGLQQQHDQQYEAQKENTIFCIIGDGESQEGQNWEAVMFAAQQKLGNLILFVDDNKQQLDNMTSKICNMDSFAEKFRSFHWDVQEVDGHNIEEIDKAIEAPVSGKPKFICCHTIKGKGVSFMENQVGWHGRPLKPEEFETAMKELEA